jgi:acetyl-CoA acetyltransferase
VDSLLVGVDPLMMLPGPHAAVPALLERNHLALDDIGVIEINEAFASVVLSFIDELKADPATINPNGGAIALGHGTMAVTQAPCRTSSGSAAPSS